MPAEKKTKIRVAVCGGGLAGICLASALTKHSHIVAQVYEGGPAISETGAGIGVAANAQRALQLIGLELYDALFAAGARRMDPSYRFVMAAGEKAGEHVVDVRPDVPELAVNRGKLLEHFVRTVRKESLHTNKKLVSIEEDSRDGLTLYFQDGTNATADAVVGTDGIYSVTRKHVLGSEASSLEPVFSGVHLYFNIVSKAEAEDKINNKYARETGLTGYLGDGAYLMNVPVEDKMMVLAQVTSEIQGDRVQAASMDELMQHYHGWKDDLAQPILKLLSLSTNLAKRAVMEHRNTPSYSRGRVCMLGDSAHSMTPWAGAGAAMAIEDVLVLERLLGKINLPSDIFAAFTAFDAIRRPRAEHVAAASRELGLLLTGRDPRGPFDIDALAKEIPMQWYWIWNVDLKEHVNEAERFFDDILRRS